MCHASTEDLWWNYSWKESSRDQQSKFSLQEFALEQVLYDYYIHVYDFGLFFTSVGVYKVAGWSTPFKLQLRWPPPCCNTNTLESGFRVRCAANSNSCVFLTLICTSSSSSSDFLYQNARILVHLYIYIFGSNRETCCLFELTAAVPFVLAPLGGTVSTLANFFSTRHRLPSFRILFSNQVRLIALDSVPLYVLEPQETFYIFFLLYMKEMALVWTLKCNESIYRDVQESVVKTYYFQDTLALRYK